MDHTQADADLVVAMAEIETGIALLKTVSCRRSPHELPSYIPTCRPGAVQKTSGTVLGALPDIRRPSITRRSTRLRRPPERLISERPSPPI